MPPTRRRPPWAHAPAALVARDGSVYLFVTAVSVVFSLRPGSQRRWTVALPFAAVSASLAALTARRPALYARHRTALAVAFRLAYAGVANVAIAGSVSRAAAATAASNATSAAQPPSTVLRFWAERSNPVVLLLLGLTSGLSAAPLAAVCMGQLAMLALFLGPACRALEARHPSHPGRFAEAASTFSRLAGGLVATLVGDAATLVDLTGVGGAGGGRGGGEGRGTEATAPPYATTCPHRTCALVMTQLYLTAFVVAIVTTLAGARRARAGAAGAGGRAGVGVRGPWWVRANPLDRLDRHARAASLEAALAVFGSWILLTAADGWAGCASASDKSGGSVF